VVQAAQQIFGVHTQHLVERVEVRQQHSALAVTATEVAELVPCLERAAQAARALARRSVAQALLPLAAVDFSVEAETLTRPAPRQTTTVRPLAAVVFLQAGTTRYQAIRAGLVQPVVEAQRRRLQQTLSKVSFQRGAVLGFLLLVA
jgi:hypothetical protein